MKYNKNNVHTYNRGGGAKRHHWTSKKNLALITAVDNLNKLISEGKITREEAENKLKKMRL